MMDTIGDMKVWHIWEAGGRRYEVPIPVQSVAEAQAVIDKRADAQVNDDGIDWNVFGLEVYEADDGTGNPGWCEWYNEDGNDIHEMEV